MMKKKEGLLKIGFLVNPVAGAGGPAALKGSDAISTAKGVYCGDISARSPARAMQFLHGLTQVSACHFFIVSGPMGEPLRQFSEVHEDCTVSFMNIDLPQHTTAESTKRVVVAMLDESLDLIVFVGGDGTARDVCSILELRVPVIGVPSGVKMHSGVFAITPIAAAKILNDVVSGVVVSLLEREVRDIDEVAFQQGLVRSRYFGELLVPDDLQYIQNVKQSGIEQDELVLCDIADDIKERLEDEENSGALCIFAGGSTTHFIEKHLGCDGTLLGVDVYADGGLQAIDCDAKQLEKMLAQHEGKVIVVLTIIGGQGHIIGRGNQQLSPVVLRRASRENLWVVATKSKLQGLHQQPLLIDSNDPELDSLWRGLIPVVTGYHDQVLYRLESGNE